MPGMRAGSCARLTHASSSGSIERRRCKNCAGPQPTISAGKCRADAGSSGSGDTLENQLLNAVRPFGGRRISDNLDVSMTVLLKEIAMPRHLLTWCLASALFIAAFAVPRAESPAAPKPNYDLAADWTAQKVGRLVFDTTVTPRWLESGDRFWYPYQTREGRKFFLVDAIKKSKAPLFDHA